MLQGWRYKVVTILLYHDCSDVLEQHCNKSDNAIKIATSCEQLVPNLMTTWEQKRVTCEHNVLTCLLADLLQDARFLRVG